jgi:hypothetical protein
MATITAANSVITLTVTGLFAAQQLQGFATDDAFSAEAVSTAETLMGIDGRLSGGFVHVKKPTLIHLQADSPSIALFDSWGAAQEAQKELYWAQGSITLPALGLSFTLIQGALENYQPFSAVKKVLQPRQFTIVWQQISPQPS